MMNASEKQIDYVMNLQQTLPESEQYDRLILENMSRREISDVIEELRSKAPRQTPGKRAQMPATPKQVDFAMQLQKGSPQYEREALERMSRSEISEVIDTLKQNAPKMPDDERMKLPATPKQVEFAMELQSGTPEFKRDELERMTRGDISAVIDRLKKAGTQGSDGHNIPPEPQRQPFVDYDVLNEAFGYDRNAAAPPEHYAEALTQTADDEVRRIEQLKGRDKLDAMLDAMSGDYDFRTY